MVKKFISLLTSVTLLLSCIGAVPASAAEASGGIEGLSDYLQYSCTLENDGKIGIPVDIYTYHDGETTASDPVIVYVINTNTERIGTDSDKKIVSEMINEKGYIVVVLDYKNNALATTPNLDWSVQGIRTKINNGTYLEGASYKKGYNYVVPSGYNITLDEYYWSIDKHAAAGSFDQIVDVWNSDFKGVKAKQTVNYKDGSTALVENTTAETIYDCVRPNGDQLDLDLRMDIIYPTNPAKKVPVMTAYSSSEVRIGVWTNEQRPHLTGFLFSGYAGAVFDYGYVPMARTDHWGYFDGNGAGSTGGVTGDNPSFSMDTYSGVKSTTAAIRHLRYIADRDSDTYNFDVDKIGVYGNSKAGLATRLGAKEAEKVPETRHFAGHHGETIYEAQQENSSYEEAALKVPAGATSVRVDGGIKVTTAKGTEYIIHDAEPQPWLTYKDGSKIPSNVQFVYANCGAGYYDITTDHAPTYATGSMKDGSYVMFYPGVLNYCKTYDVPCVGLSFPMLGHAFVRDEVDKDYGVNGYQGLFDMANYYLRGDGAVCLYITTDGGNTSIDTKSKITVKFSGGVPASEIEKVTVTNSATGDVAKGSWTSSYGDTEWQFAPHNLMGGCEYVVNVPDTIVCDNGENVIAEKSYTFTTVRESLAEATTVASTNNDMTLLKYADSTDNKVFYSFDAADFSTSTSIGMRFSVENDAANTVEVYALSAIDENDITASTIGEKLGEVVLIGKGDYEIDVTKYVHANNNSKVGFMLKAKNNKEDKVTKYDFESGTTDVTWSTSDINAAVSTDVNNTSGGSSSLKISDMLSSSINGYYHIVASTKKLAFNKAIKSSALTADDYGRKFNIKMSVYDTTSRSFIAEINRWEASGGNNDRHDLVDWDAELLSERTTANAWKTFEMTHRIDNPLQWSSQDQRKLTLQLGSTIAAENKPVYIDDVIVTEEISDVQIASETTKSSFAPSLVLHPAKMHTLEATDTAYVESGDNADNVMEGTNALVSGRSKSMDPTIGKSYVKLSLENYTSGQIFFGFETLAGNKGNVDVYGVSDLNLAQNWSSDTINYLNAPANDIYSAGVNTSLVFEGEAIDTIEVDGAATHNVDISRYASNMKAKGAEYITLIFANKSEGKEIVASTSFDTSASPYSAYPGGGLHDYGTDKSKDHTGNSGYSYFIKPTSAASERLRFNFIDYQNLSEKDIGRTFEVTYYAMSTVPNTTYYNSLMSIAGCGHRNINKTTYTLATANKWEKITYNFTLTEDIINHTENNSTVTDYAAACVNFEGITIGATLYIDDIVLRESGYGRVDIKPITNVVADTVVQNIDFDTLNSTSGLYTGGGFELSDATQPTKVSISSEADATTGAGKSFKFEPNKQYNRLKFNNVFNKTLTAEDVGRVLKVSFKANANKEGTFTYGWMTSIARHGATAAAADPNGDGTALTEAEKGEYTLAYGETPDKKDYSSEIYDQKTATIAASDIGKWRTYELDVKITADMLAKTVWNKRSKTWQESELSLLSIVPSGMPKNANNFTEGVVIYVDDIMVTEAPTDGDTANTPYVYDMNFDGVTADDVMQNGGGLESVKLTADAARKTVIDVFAIDSTVKNSGTNSLKITSHKNYNRFKLLNVVSATPAEGDEYNVSLYVKATKPGTIKFRLQSDADYGDDSHTYNSGEQWQQFLCTITADDVASGAFKKFDFSFTVDANFIKYGINRLTVTPDCGQNYTKDTNNVITSADPVYVYIDDLYSSKVVESGNTLPISDQAYVSGTGTVNATNLMAIGSTNEEAPKYIKKAYFKFDGNAEYGYTQRATLKLDVADANGQEVSIYAISGESYPSRLTYNTAPAWREDESIDLSYAELVRTLSLPTSGTYEFDVTDYVLDNAPNDSIFAVTTDVVGGCEYMNLDFDTYTFSKDVDFVGNATVASGKANVTGDEIQILNAFTNVGAKAGAKYYITADVTPAASGTFTIAASKAGAEGSLASTSAELTAGVSGKLMLEYTATTNGEADAITISAPDGAASFAIDNVVVKDESYVSIGSASKLLVETAQEPELPVFTVSDFDYNVDGIKTAGKFSAGLLKAWVNVNSTSSKKVTILAAQFTNEHKLIKMNWFEKTPGENDKVEVELTIDSAKDSYVKLMVWNGVDLLVPIKNCITLIPAE